jgi:hypothetical protein
MTGNAEIVKLNIRYYEGLLVGDNTTYAPVESLKLLEAAKARLARIEAQGPDPIDQATFGTGLRAIGR